MPLFLPAPPLCPAKFAEKSHERNTNTITDTAARRRRGSRSRQPPRLRQRLRSRRRQPPAHCRAARRRPPRRLRPAARKNLLFLGARRRAHSPWLRRRRDIHRHRRNHSHPRQPGHSLRLDRRLRRNLHNRRLVLPALFRRNIFFSRRCAAIPGDGVRHCGKSGIVGRNRRTAAQRHLLRMERLAAIGRPRRDGETSRESDGKPSTASPAGLHADKPGRHTHGFGTAR